MAAYANAGHRIENHSYTHPFASSVGLDVFVSEIDQAEENLSGYANRRPWFRFPSLDEGSTPELRDGIRFALSERGLFNAYVTVDNFDCYMDRQLAKALRDGRTVNMDALKAAYVDMLLEAVTFFDNVSIESFGETVPHVLLLHENDLAALFVDDLVAVLREKGWEIISPDEAYAHPIASIQPNTLVAHFGKVAALAINAGRDPSTFRLLPNSVSELDAFVAARGVFGAAP